LPRISSAKILKAKQGFTLLEMLTVLVIAGLMTAMVWPALRGAMSQTAIQTTFFDFQRQATDLRAQAFHERQSIQLVGTGQFVDDPLIDPRPAEIQFQEESWSYQVSEAMLITAGGVCSPISAFVYQDGELAMRLDSQPDCHFLRVE
jgi:prepilin-type N-terminal cleavage/methylation domain-containing protein